MQLLAPGTASECVSSQCPNSVFPNVRALRGNEQGQLLSSGPAHGTESRVQENERLKSLVRFS